jgi:uncharacterized repeat protein (TIGR02543 family)
LRILKEERRKKYVKKIVSMLIISLLVLSTIFAIPLIHATGATISTDKADYSPGDTVTIYGSGFLEGTVSMTVTRPDGSTNGWAVTSDSSGSFTTTYALDGIEGVYTVIASDGTNTATTTFIDALTYTPSRYPPTGSATVAAGSSISFTLTLSDTVPSGQAPLTYTRKSLIAKTGWTHMDDAWVTTDPSSFTKPAGPFSQVVTVTITVPSGAAPDGYAAILKYTPREGSGCEIYIAVTPAPVVTATVTFGQFGVGTDFTGTVLTVDGTDYWGVSDLPKTYTWNVGDPHTFAYGSPLDTGLGTQYVWTSTSGLSTAQSGTITVPSIDGSVTGHYKTQYYLTVTSPYGTTSGEGWYDSGDTAYADVSPLTVSGGSGVQYVFTGWSGDASGSTSPSDPITMNSPKTAVANWKTQYYLTVVSPYDTPSGEGWYDENTNAYAHLATGTVDITPDWVRAVFTGWSGDASGTGLTSDPIYMSGPKTATANWKIQYYLKVVSDPSLIPPMPGADWYDSSTHVTLTADAYYPSEAGLNGVRYRFSYWDVDDTPFSGNPIDVHMDTYHTATAHYIIQYYLTLTTSPVSGINAPSGGGWYDGGTIASISTESLVDIDAGSRWSFDSWTTAFMSEITNYVSASTTVLMDKAKTVTANYVKQYLITFATSGVGSDFTGKAMKIEGTEYNRNGYSFWWDDQSLHSLEFYSPLTVSSSKEYIWASTSGLSTLQKDTSFKVTTSGSITGNYATLEGFMTNSNFNRITKFDTVWTPADTRKINFKLSATNPGQFMYNIYINTPVTINTLTITYNIPSDFVLHGADPIQVWTQNAKTGTRIPATISGKTITISGIGPGELYVTFHLDYGPAGKIYPKATKDGWKGAHPSYTFEASFIGNGLSGTSSTILLDPTVTLGE